jgi:hypothetical protein
VPGGVRQNILVAGICQASSCVPAYSRIYSLFLFEEVFNPPETPTGENRLGDRLLLPENQGDGIDAVTRILFGESFTQEYMAQMALAGCADNFRPASIGIGMTLYGVGDFIVE